MPRTLGDCFLHVNSIDMLVPFDEPVVTAETEPSDDVLRRIGQNVARLVEDGSTIECSIGRIAQAMAEFLKDKKELGIHTEMFGDWIIDLVECGAVTCSKKTINRGKIVASFAMGSKRLYDYIDNNPFFEFHPTEYVNDPFVISQHDKWSASTRDWKSTSPARSAPTHRVIAFAAASADRSTSSAAVPGAGAAKA